MPAKTTFLMNRVLDRVLKNNADLSYAFPATVYAALFTADPTNTGSLTNEVSGTAYARQAIVWGAIAAGSVASNGAITFPVAGGSWSTVTHVGIMDVATLAAGDMLYHGVLGTPKLVGTGDQVSFASGALVLTET